MGETGHFQRLRPLIAGLTRRGAEAHVYTHHDFRAQVDAAGGVFHDLFSKNPLDRADATSQPIASRSVSFAAFYAAEIGRDVEGIRPSLVIHDSFAVIGRVVAHLLGVPRVNVCAGHNVTPLQVPALVAGHPRVRVSLACAKAVDALRESYDVPDASPFSYVCAISPTLNIYCEPPEFLQEPERQFFEPVAFYGCLPSPEDERRAGKANGGWFGPESRSALKVYVSFGTVVWRYYTDEALRALAVLSTALGRLEHVRAIVSLGGASIDDQVRAALARPNVAVERYVDQWNVLRDADLFVTHHGMNSTHEAIAHGVPMVSYPFFWDQPALARRCQELGLALPLARSLRGVFGVDEVQAVLGRAVDDRASLRAALARALGWEQAVMGQRDAVLDRIAEIAASEPGTQTPARGGSRGPRRGRQR
jgi:MGT family glycosyltransferase